MKTRAGTIRRDAPIGPDPPEAWWKTARLVFPPAGPGKVSVTLRLDQDLVGWFKAQGRGHLTRMNAVLRSYYEAHKSA